MPHAEQLTLKKAIERINVKRPRDKKTTSVERYYRELLFNSLDSAGNFLVGGTIYTTLEPCPFCTAALLVNRMKRIVVNTVCQTSQFRSKMTTSPTSIASL